jgi:thymidylate synthase
MINIIFAADQNNGIGLNGSIPWAPERGRTALRAPCGSGSGDLIAGLAEDQKIFKELTTGHAVIMGRKTYESLKRPEGLPNRTNIVISRTAHEPSTTGPLYFTDPDLAVEFCKKNGLQAFIIGGSELYKKYMPVANRIYYTLVFGDFKCDTFIGPLVGQDRPVGTIIPHGHVLYNSKVLFSPTAGPVGLFMEYRPGLSQGPNPFIGPYKASEEYQYLDIIENVLKNGCLKSNRTSVDTLNIFGTKSVYSLKNGTIPLLTTKKVFFRAVVEELLWFISGSTDSKILESKGIGIWSGNTTREFLDSRGLTDLPEGSIGAGYGFQWRHSGAEYPIPSHPFAYEGVDQLADLVSQLKNDPGSRRMLICSWNPSALSRMALPPCHIVYQVYVEPGTDTGPYGPRGKNILHSIMYQRSADVGLGVPFNIASYALLTIILAHCTGYEPGSFTHFTGDTHVYTNHVEQLRLQIQRVPKEFPVVKIRPVTGLVGPEWTTSIFDLVYENFELVGYNPDTGLKMDMVV